MANRFYIDPWGGHAEAFQQGMRGIGAVIGERRAEKKRQDLARQGQEIFATGDPDKISEFMIANPEIGENLQGAVEFKSDLTRKNMIDTTRQILGGGDPETILGARLEMLRQQGADTTQTEEALQEYREDPEGFMKNAEIALSLYDPSGFKEYRKAKTGEIGDIGTEEAEFNRLIAGLTPKEQERAKRIKLGLAPRAQGSSALTIAESGKTGDVAESEAIIAGAESGAKEAAKLKAQFNLKPQVEAAVADAVGAAKAKVEQMGEARSNAKAMEVYNTAMGFLGDAMEEAYTGPIAGLVPALTADAQIADGAVAAMAPVLKQLFRSAGEGVFTDKDQELLLGMVPTRKDLPEARAAKIRNIDAIVRAKLSTPDAAQQGKPKIPEGSVLVQDANGNKAYKTPDGQYIEVQ